MSSGYDPVSTTDSLLPHHSDKKSFDYDSIFNYDAPPEEKKFKSVYKYEELSNKNCYEADYYTVRYEELELMILHFLLSSMSRTAVTRPPS